MGMTKGGVYEDVEEMQSDGVGLDGLVLRVCAAAEATRGEAPLLCVGV